MGAEPYWYYTPYQSDLNLALQTLRAREFQADRYNPAIPFLDFPLSEDSPAPGAQHSSIEDALEASDADGTRSILNIFRVSDTPYPFLKEEFEAVLLGEESHELLHQVFNTAFPLPSAELVALFSTEQPTQEMIDTFIFGNKNPEESGAFFDSIDRGTARYIIVYEVDQPREIFFIGYSFD